MIRQPRQSGASRPDRVLDPTPIRAAGRLTWEMPVTAIDVHAFEVHVDHATLRGEWAGDGPVVVLLHAGICDRRMWDVEFAALAERYRVVRYDLRGVGDSIPDVATDGRPFAHHTDLVAVLDTLGIDGATLVGCSMGGRVALDTTLAAPDRVSALAMACSRPSGSAPDRTIQAAIERIDEAIVRGDLAGANELELRLWVDGPDRGPDAVAPELREWVASMNLAALGSGWEGRGEQPLDPPAIDRLDEVTCPVLVMVGDLDVAGTVESGERMADAIPGARLIRFRRGAHLPSLEEPERFLRHLTAFLPPPDDDVESPLTAARAHAAMSGG